MAMPWDAASAGLRNLTLCPCHSISPLSRSSMPATIFISVDLPAPFSPISKWTAPVETSRFPSRRAATPPKFLRTDFSCSSIAVSGGISAIDHPWDAESIDEHTEEEGPESLLEGHLHGAALGQSVEDALGFCRIVDVNRQRETLRLLILPGKGVDALQHLIANGERRMDDFVATALRELIRRDRVPVGRHERAFGAQAPLVEPKGLLALAVEG